MNKHYTFAFTFDGVEHIGYEVAKNTTELRNKLFPTIIVSRIISVRKPTEEEDYE